MNQAQGYSTETKRIFIVPEIAQTLREENKNENETKTKTKQKQELNKNNIQIFSYFTPSFYFGFLPHLFLSISIEQLHYRQCTMAGINSSYNKELIALLSASNFCL